MILIWVRGEQPLHAVYHVRMWSGPVLLSIMMCSSCGCGNAFVFLAGECPFLPTLLWVACANSAAFILKCRGQVSLQELLGLHHCCFFRDRIRKQGRQVPYTFVLVGVTLKFLLPCCFACCFFFMLGSEVNYLEEHGSVSYRQDFLSGKSNKQERGC